MHSNHLRLFYPQGDFYKQSILVSHTPKIQLRAAGLNQVLKNHRSHNDQMERRHESIAQLLEDGQVQSDCLAQLNYTELYFKSVQTEYPRAERNTSAYEGHPSSRRPKFVIIIIIIVLYRELASTHLTLEYIDSILTCHMTKMKTC